MTGTPFYDPELAIVKFNSFWRIELEPGYSLFATHPVNRADLPFRLLTGIVDSDRFTDVGVLFPAVWTDANFEGVLPRATPIAQCFPVLREALALQFQAFSAEVAERYQSTANTCSHVPVLIGVDFACGASVPASRRRRSRAELSQSWPFPADVSAWTIRPNVSGRSRIARR
jgi:hypothetical protein